MARLIELLKRIYGRIRRLFNKKTVAVIVTALVASYYLHHTINLRTLDVKLSFFVLGLSKDLIKEVLVRGQQVLFKMSSSNSWYSANASLLTNDRLFQLLTEHPGVVYSCEEPSNFNNILAVAYLAACFWLGSKLYNSIENKQSFKDLKDQRYMSKNRFSDVYGLENVKRELQEIIDYLKDPGRYQRVGARLRRGVLLYGPPGTGKTLLARAAAGESNSAFLYCAASEFVEMYVGVGAKRIRDLFAKARSLAPCIVFIDEIDGVGAKRNVHHGEMGSDNERSTTLNQLLTEMDGFLEGDNITMPYYALVVLTQR
eukprot:TRINITY_DN6878_c0_g1_i1.p1 TRINITY_DN6878_c0_g1~~TRINITY_DN6878_c0_g1_i1.p1  ORF type:complete len:314 (+),score=46.90 TRINITY_DN6878_c0_g1_i1:38-979(+)